MRFVAIIPARKGSKGVEGKNIKLLGGAPLIEYSILTSISCSLIDKTIVTSDDQRALEIGIRHGCIAHKRPSVLSEDNTGMFEVLKDVILKFDLESHFDAIILLQPTSPFRDKVFLEDCIKCFETNDSDSLMSIKNVDSDILKSLIEVNSEYIPINDESFLFSRRQDLPNVAKVDGSVFIFNIKSLTNSNTLFLNNPKYILNRTKYNIDIDTPSDFLTAENYLKLINKQ